MQQSLLLVWQIEASKSKKKDLLTQVSTLTEAGSELLEGYEVSIVRMLAMLHLHCILQAL